MADTPPYSSILRSVSGDKFGEIIGASTRKSRETYFARHGIRAPKAGRGFQKPGTKNEARAAALFDVLQSKDDDELAEELLRTYLLTKREILGAALDHLGIEHENGLTDSDEVEKFSALGKSEISSMVSELEKFGPRDDVVLYLKYMGAPDVDAV